MNTKIVTAVIAVIILLGLGWFLFAGKNTKPQTQSTTTSSSPTVAQSAAQNLLDLLAAGKTQKCDFSYKAADGASTNGTVYITAAKMRGNITTTSKDNKVTKIYMIRDGNTSYVWGDSFPGVKMTLTADQLKTNSTTNQYFNTQQKTDYKCESWSVDNSMFTVPTNVKFTDVSALMPKASGVPSGAGTGVNTKCIACNYLSGTAKTECLALYSCQ